MSDIPPDVIAGDSDEWHIAHLATGQRARPGDTLTCRRGTNAHLAFYVPPDATDAAGWVGVIWPDQPFVMSRLRPAVFGLMIIDTDY